MSEITVLKLRKMKEAGEKIVMITAYDYPSSKLVDEAGVDLILVGDSLGVVLLGYDNTLAVTMEDMVHHTKAVSRAAKRAMVVADMPFLSYQISIEAAVANAGRFLQEAGAQAVKLEGGREIVPIISKITIAGIPVIGHLGFTPQSVHQIGGAIFQGKTAANAVKLLEDALYLQDAGVFAIVLELIPFEAAELITGRLKTPTIGIGSGPKCDGQVLVYHDLLGLNADFQPKHSKIFANAGQVIKEGVADYVTEVRQLKFPTVENTKRMEQTEFEELRRMIGNGFPMN
jgi:3-methyl-2-oxobutanoate hydroxymethyltransferase